MTWNRWNLKFLPLNYIKRSFALFRALQELKRDIWLDLWTHLGSLHTLLKGISALPLSSYLKPNL